MATKTAQRSSGSKAAPSEHAAPSEPQEQEHPRTATVTLPFVTAQFRAPDLHLPTMPDRDDLADAVAVVSSRLPTPTQAVYYVGLVALGVLELIEWPVVLAVGVGTALAQQACGQQRIEPQTPGETPGKQARPAG